MSKILKRPMFRKGGKAMDGVMSLADSRNNYQEGGMTTEELRQQYPDLGADYQKYLDFYRAVGARDEAAEKKDILSNLLIRGGLGLVAGEGAGKGTLGALATSFRGPTEQAMGELAGIKKSEQAIRSAAAGSAVEAEAARAKAKAELQLQAAKGGKEFASEQFNAKVNAILSLYEDVPGMDPNTAIGLARKDVRADEVLGNKYQGMLRMNPRDKTQIDIGWIQTQPDGGVFLNPYTGLYYKKKGQTLILLDQDTLEEPKGE